MSRREIRRKEGVMKNRKKGRETKRKEKKRGGGEVGEVRSSEGGMKEGRGRRER